MWGRGGGGVISGDRQERDLDVSSESCRQDQQVLRTEISTIRVAGIDPTYEEWSAASTCFVELRVILQYRLSAVW